MIEVKNIFKQINTETENDFSALALFKKKQHFFDLFIKFIIFF